MAIPYSGTFRGGLGGCGLGRGRYVVHHGAASGSGDDALTAARGHGDLAGGGDRPCRPGGIARGAAAAAERRLFLS